VKQSQGRRTGWVNGPVSREGHIKRGRAAMEGEVHSLNCVALVELLGGRKSKGSAAQDEGDSWKCESHV
jgi:hypothetical protein